MSGIDLNALADRRRRGEEHKTQTDAAEACATKDRLEEARCDAVNRALDPELLQEKLDEAADSGKEECRILKLDSCAKSDDDLTKPAPTRKRHLNSAAYERLWDALEKEELRPFIDHEHLGDKSEGRAWTDHYITVRLP